MRKFVASSLAVGAATAGMIALSAPSALAATWTVTNPDSSGTFTSALLSGTTVAFRDTTTSQPFTCTSSSIPGTATSGTGKPDTGLATLSTGSFSGCKGNLGSTGTATLTSGSLNGVSYSSGVTTGTITGVNATLSISDLLGTCSAAVSGEVDNVTYTNSTGQLKVVADTTPHLTITSATGSGCAGLINAGDSATFAATYVVSPVITVTSP
ncbi:hypothetical protein [Actinoallomurus acaciae]|uniref:Secreted protein n=1 Tax=Actinoallomurus acaciae TaxID=502577 RepID=A0ABV5YHG5_9ACTN